MKLKKYSYAIVIALLLFTGVNKTYAETKNCYYISNDGNFKIRAKLKFENYGAGIYEYGNANATVDKIDGNSKKIETNISNWIKHDGIFRKSDDCIADDSVCFGYKYGLNETVGNSEPPCPKYLVLQRTARDWVFATDDAGKAQSAKTNLGGKGYYGIQTTSKKYYEEYIEQGLIKSDPEGNWSCEKYDAIFGSKTDPSSISYMVNEALKYIRIIVPILIILLGTLDFAKAVLAGKADEMKKAQSTFVKRLIAGVAVFFVPILVNIIMDLADIVWAGEGYSICPL